MREIYTVPINGTPHTFKLTESEARARGLTAADKVSTKERTPKNKARK